MISGQLSVLRKDRPTGPVSDAGRLGSSWHDHGDLLAAEEAEPGWSLLQISLNPGAGPRPGSPALRIKLSNGKANFPYLTVFILNYYL